MNVPTVRQFRILKLLAGGASLLIVNKGTSAYTISVNDIAVDRVKIATVQAMTDAGWLQINFARAQFEITKAGHALLDCKTFVRLLPHFQTAS